MVLPAYRRGFPYNLYLVKCRWFELVLDFSYALDFLIGEVTIWWNIVDH